MALGNGIFWARERNLKGTRHAEVISLGTRIVSRRQAHFLFARSKTRSTNITRGNILALSHRALAERSMFRPRFVQQRSLFKPGPSSIRSSVPIAR
jgi:hypothetical protein